MLRVATSYKLRGLADGMQVGMKRIVPALWQSSTTLGLCVGLSACALAKRDFIDKNSGETEAGVSSFSRGETESVGAASSATGTTHEESGGEPVSATEGIPDHPSATPSTAGVNSPQGQTSEAPMHSTDASYVDPDETSPGQTSADESDATTQDEPTGSRCDQNILRNGNFESGSQGWSVSSSYSAFEQRVHPLIVDAAHESLTGYSITAHEGSRFAFLGDVPDDQYMGYHTTLTQTVFVPEEAVGLAVVGHVWISTEELPEQEWDIGYVQLELPDNDDDYWQFVYWSNLDATDGWVKFDDYIDDLSELRGKSVNFVLQAVTDADTPTRYWFDDIELVVVCP